MNTRISYLYRDACNHKSFNDTIVAGDLFIDHLTPFLKDRLLFIPSKVGMLDFQPNEWTEDDHIWHELEKLEATQEDPTMNIAAEKLIEQFRIAHLNEWYEFS
ncbi:MAG: hypothetical protein U9P73_03255 [Candidatus Cloacimonadota bacterium]|nr:hypothetical protein [Candidatus Cloacimonadota bacterium]